MNAPPSNSREIVRRSGSNLAFALAILPRAVRRDMEVFYAFCRVIDDLVDEPGLEMESRRAGLDRWREVIGGTATEYHPGVESEFAELIRRLDLNRDDLSAIIDGMEMDLTPNTFPTVDDLRLYCYRVASAVGLVSVRIFGCLDPQARSYAEQLGYALQWTNILRDVGEDARKGRVFLPREHLNRFGLAMEDMLSGKPHPEKFLQLMQYETLIARAHYREALAILATLPRFDQGALCSAELMRRIYTDILDAMERDGFRVYDMRYRPGKLMLLTEFLRAKFFS